MASVSWGFAQLCRFLQLTPRVKCVQLPTKTGSCVPSPLPPLLRGEREEEGSAVDGQLNPDHGEQADADNAVDVEEGDVDPAQVVRPDQPVLVEEQQRHRADTNQVDGP